MNTTYKNDPIRIHRALSGLSFPATKPSIVQFVSRKTPDNAVSLRIGELPQVTYKNELDILTSLGISPSAVKKPKKRLVPEAMTVPRQQAIRGTALLIALGKQDMDVYAVRGRSLRLLRSFKTPKGRYSDTEGHFKIRRGGGTIRSGVPREVSRQLISEEFLREVSPYFQTLADEGFSRVALFVPPYMKNTFISALPAALKQKITNVIEGNFRKSHPNLLLQKIKEDVL